MNNPEFGSNEPLVESLTTRELDILSLLAEKRSNREIAAALALSLNTVKWYARQIYGKLEVRNRRQAVSRARELGLLQASARAPVPKHNFPAQLTPFLGRREELVELGGLIACPTCRLLTLIGPGGIGKTRLAIQLASLLLREKQDSFEDGGFFVPLAPLGDPVFIVPALAQALRFSFYEGKIEPRQQLIRYLRQKRMLLVLDNFEHLIVCESLDLLTDILTAAPGVKMLITSSARLNVQGEQLFSVGGMAIPEVDSVSRWGQTVEEAEAFSGIQLFQQAARRVRPDFNFCPESLPPIARICRLVEGMPLGIELAAAWMEVLEPEEILSEIEGSLDFLETKASNVPERQRSLRAVFDHSWDLLDEQERDAFQGLSVFRRGFTRQAAQQVSGALPGALMALINKCWIQRKADGGYQVHRLLRQYGAEKLAQDPALETAVRDRHSAHYCDWLGELKKDIKGGEQQAALTAIKGEYENVRTACKWAAERGQIEQLDHAVSTLGGFYQLSSDYQAGDITFQGLAEALPPVDTASVQSARARLLVWRGIFKRLLGDLQASFHLVQKSLAVLDAPNLADQDTRPERASIAVQLGYLWLYSADLKAAQQNFARAHELYQALGDKWGMAYALMGLSRALCNLGALERAQEAATQSLALHQDVGNQVGYGEALMLLGDLAARQGQFQEAERLVQQSLSATPETDRNGIAYGLALLGRVQSLVGQFAEAEAS